MMIKEGSTKIVNFMTHVAGVLAFGHDHIVKMQYFSSSCVHWGMGQTNKVYNNYDQGRVYQNCKYHDP